MEGREPLRAVQGVGALALVALDTAVEQSRDNSAEAVESVHVVFLMHSGIDK